MADFALWATACETALWPAGTFSSAYSGNRDEAVEGVIEADLIATAVHAFMATRTEWTGTASDLLGALTEAAGERIARSKTWPDSPRALSGRLRRAATSLRKIGIEIVLGGREGRKRNRVIEIIVTPENAGTPPSASPAPSAPPLQSSAGDGLPASAKRTVASNVNGSATPTVRTKPLGKNGENDADGTDAKSPFQSAARGTATPGWRGRI